MFPYLILISLMFPGLKRTETTEGVVYQQKRQSKNDILQQAKRNQFLRWSQEILQSMNENENQK